MLTFFQVGDPTESKQHREILKYGIPDQGPLIRVYENHILSYDQAKKTPIWVAEYITKKNTNGKSKKKPTLFEFFLQKM